jgi:tRNA-2-methylthio-N6-dimethylallyladenosine synthase
MKGILCKNGYSITEEQEEADVAIINSCAVREKAENKMYGKLGRLKALKSKNPHLIIGLCGCVAEKEKETLLKKKEVNFIFGTRNIVDIDSMIKRVKNGERFAEFKDSLDEINFETPRMRDSKHHAWVTIIYGCNKFCSYCIVPYTRGREKSRKMRDILSEVEKLAANGYKEITYLGQNVDSYGLDLDDNTSFARLLKETCKINGIERIWFLTSYPSDFSDDLIKVISEEKKISRFIHLPVQAGSNKILKAMNRRYTREDYLTLVKKIKESVPDVVLGSDIIVGFPGETEDDFQESVDLVKEARFERLNLALYSPRKGTLSAENMRNSVSHEIKAERLQLLMDLQKSINYEANLNYRDKNFKVIVEGTMKNGDYYGRINNNKLVVFSFDSNVVVGEKVTVKIKKVSAGLLFGEMAYEKL